MYKLHLILKYLRRRRIAWVSLLAVMLCTAMVIVVISIMGGWLRMFETNARGMTGDIVMKAPGLSGFSYYEKMIEQIERLPYVEAAVPQIVANGLVAIGVEGRPPQRSDGVQVFGIQIDKVGRVNNWPQSLYLQHTDYLENGEKPPTQKTFDPRRGTASIQVGELPAGVIFRPSIAVPRAALERFLNWQPVPLRFTQETLRWSMPFLLSPEDAATTPPEPIWDRVTYHFGGWLTVRGKMSDDDVAALRRPTTAVAKRWRQQVLALGVLTNRPGLIAGARVIDVRKDRQGKIVGRNDWKYRELYANVTVLGIGIGETVDPEKRAERTFWVIDDSRTGMWQYDNKSIYMDFDLLQRDLDMQAKEEELLSSGEKVIRPARTSEVNIKLRPGTSTAMARAEIEQIALGVIEPRRRDLNTRQYAVMPRVQTWRDASQTYLNAIETEKVLVVFLFAIISVVAVFLIFCIFYMIVAEKTKDIGIIKSVGATNGGVAGIFLGYGLAIGIVGAGLGLLLSYLIIHNVNEIHDWLGSTFRLVVWNPEVYAFDTIPNTMDLTTVSVILIVAVKASVLGALVPAIRAARMQPVEALRWE